VAGVTPSPSALTAAAARAAHLIVDQPPLIFADTLAEVLLGEEADELLGYHRAHGQHVVLAGARAQVICRARYTEDALARGVRRGVGQYVILGAGLDSFAYRSELAGSELAVFEVDHPASQRWKRQRLSDARVAVPEAVTYVPVDFESDSLPDRLTAAGFDRSRPAVVGWLGVSMYLTRDAIAQTLAVIGGFAPGTEIILDYLVPPDLRDAAGQVYVDLVGPVTAQRGEPWLSFLTPTEMTGMLADNGFTRIVHAEQQDMIPAALWDGQDSLKPSNLARIAHGHLL
jgi:methyltransferase (TIGR00027 family)